jgi:hypothetical protein
MEKRERRPLAVHCLSSSDSTGLLWREEPLLVRCAGPCAPHIFFVLMVYDSWEEVVESMLHLLHTQHTNQKTDSNVSRLL